MPRSLFLIAALLSSTACSSADEIENEVGVERSQASAPDGAEAEAAEAVAFVDNTGEGVAERMFAYSWPAEVSAIEPLAAELAAERDKALAEQKAEYEAAQADSPEDCDPCRTRSAETEWQVVADLPRFLSLSAGFSVYTGGAHGNYGTRSLVWDREAGQRLAATDLFRSPGGLYGAISRRYCAALNAEREERRGEPVDPDDEYFGDCPGIDELTVLPGSSNGRTFDRIGVIADPYVAGSYAEGSYEVTLPVDTAVIDAVKPEYVDAFSLGARK
ncbi:DUF4163 domain-containing protein [Qipengyuania sp. MTN3-11]|uniref:DUF4163 domain-containing protein n=1 Tax=Qipengyuania sp. MTN3-11 TaxID=3056557 RepID=UPI0036F2253A